MNMNSKKKELLNETYHKFIQTSLYDLPLEGIDEFIDQNIMGYGTTIDEKILSISDYRKLVIRQREQGKDIKMQFDITPVVQKIVADGNSAVFVDEILIKMLIKNETHKLFLRISTVLEYKDQKWIVVHWHGSKPEHENGESDTWHIDEWKQKNAELEKQVEEKTTDLIIKNRELEIEASLERVRAVAMGMHSSEDLALTIDTFFSELNNLGIKPHRCGVGIVNKETRIVDAHATTVTENNEIKKVVGELHLAGHPVLDKIFETWVKQEEYHPVLHGNEISEYHRVMNPQFDVPDFADDEVQFGYYFYFKEGGVFAWTNKEFTDNELDIFRRYTSVLSLTYRRYIDLKEAEAQAREAQIEAALEKVRCKDNGACKRAMSSKDSDSDSIRTI